MLRRVGLLVAVLIGLLSLAAPAYAAGGESIIGDGAQLDPSLLARESITSYDTRLEVHADGKVRVTETIGYDFVKNRRHGIIRIIPVRFRYDDTHDRITPISDVSVTRDGNAEQVTQSSAGGNEELKIGNPKNNNVTGQHTYVLTYTVAGAINAFADHDELYWNAVGDEWGVPIRSATSAVTAPAAITRVICFAGAQDSHLPCDSATASGATASFHHGDLRAHEGLTLVVALPKGAVASGPILTRHQSFANAFQLTPWTVGGGVALAVLGVGAALAVGWRVGRDRRYVGLLPGLVPEKGEHAEEERKPVIGKPPVSVEFVPPEKIRPGQVGTLIDEHANVLDVTATIIDFAVRKHLHIRELPKSTPQDWQLTKLTDGDPAFLPYERTLFGAIFNGRDKVRLSELRTTFAKDLAKVRGQLYTDMVTQGWYRTSPARTRTVARAIALGILVASGLITLLLALLGGLGLLGLGLVAGAVALMVAAGRFPARTGKGSAMLERVQGFRLYVATAEAEQIKFQEREQIFSAYLPYAMVFGLADRWAKTFASIADTAQDGVPRATPGLYWFAGAAGFSLAHFNDSIGSFTTTTAGAIVATPAAASGSSGFESAGGFAGGGFGGGGGGSW